MLNEYLHIMSDLGHVLSELTWEITFLLLGMALSRGQAKREHRKHHEEDVDVDALLDLDPNEPIPYILEETRG